MPDPSRYLVTLTFELEVEALNAGSALTRGKRVVRKGGRAQVIRAVAVKLP